MKLVTAVLAAAFLAGASANILFADVTATAQVKPATRSEFRRREVIKRLDKQRREIRTKVNAGTLRRSLGDALDQKDKAIRMDEENLSAQRGGDITKREQRSLDSRLNDIHTDMNE
jgi:ribosome recycling factor